LTLIAALAFNFFVIDENNRVPTPERFLFVQNAEAGSLTADGDAYSLQLLGVDPRVVFFSDRPYRDTGAMSVDSLIQDVFEPSETPPNAALVFSDLSDPDAVTLALELSDPKYDSNAAELTYRAAPLDQPSPGLAHLRFDAVSESPAEFTRPSLFIDSDSYHHCAGYLINKTSFTFTLAETDPGPGDRWGDYPPHTISPGATVWWKFKFHSNSNEKTAIIRYDGGGTDPLGSSYSLEFSLVCSTNFVGVGQGVDRSSCTVSLFDTFTCDKDTLPPDSTPSLASVDYVTYSLNPTH
jgi:hypothetical protein